MIRLIAITGPTATGKSALAVSVASALGGEVISCDSVSVYRGMDIGSAKPSAEEMRGIPHHLIDVADPRVGFSAADYAAAADRAVGDIISRGKVPVVCGGTGLYLDSLLRVGTLSPVSAVPSVRGELQALGNDELYTRLAVVDTAAAAATHPNNRVRVIRALEIFLQTGVTKTEWDERSRRAPRKYSAVMIGLDYSDRAVLYDRIDRRTDAMFRDGLVDEVKGLLSRGMLPATSIASRAIGYAETARYIAGEATLGETVDAVKQETRRYAKRQITWFSRYADMNSFLRGGDDCDIKHIVNNVLNLLTNRFGYDIINRISIGG